MAEKMHIFFDLDHTLWDFETNSQDALTELFETHQLAKAGVPSEVEFIRLYKAENDRCWADYRHGRMTKEVLRVERFIRALARYQVNDPSLAADLADDYVAISPSKTRLMPGSIEALEYIKSRNHVLHILTNGFKEVQYRKLDGSGLTPYFTGIFTSEELGFNKPHAEAFLRALDRADATAEQTWMIGDNLEADVMGAHRAGLKTVFYQPNGWDEVPAEADVSVRHLDELKDLF